nr:unnamed protein product [Haemonchus contortus]
MQMLLLFTLVTLLGAIASVKGSETPLDEKETFVTLNSMYTNDLVWSDELAQKALDWLKSPEHRNRIKADLIVGGRGLVADAKDKLVWQKILDVLEIHFDEKEAELERLPPGTLYGSGTETPLDEKETFVTLNSMYTNDLVWSDELAQKALDWLKSPEHRNRIKADLIVGGRGLVADAKDKLVWQKILDVLEIHFDEKEAELERLPPGTLFGCNGYMSTRSTKDDYVSAVCLYRLERVMVISFPQ